MLNLSEACCIRCLCCTTTYVLWVFTDERPQNQQVLAVELSKVDNGAEIYDFSQYPGMPEYQLNLSSPFAPPAPALCPELNHVRALTKAVSGERETVWNTCAYLEYLHGRDEIRVTQWGVVRVLKVKPNANTKVLTVEVS